MKRFKKIALVILVLSLFTLPSYAKAPTAEDFISDFEELIPEESGLSSDSEELISGVGFDALLSELISTVSGRGSELVSFFLLLLGLGLAFSLVELSGVFAESRFSEGMRSGISVIASLLIFSRLNSLVTSVADNLTSLSSFFSSLIPVITGLSLAGGAVGTASVQAVNMNITLSIIGKISSDFLLPLVFMMFAFALVGSIGEGGISPLAKGVRSVFMWGFGIVSAVLVASVSMQSFLASSADGAVLRAAKYAVSGSIPIVGTTVSGALSTLSGALAHAGTTVGVGAVAVILLMSASPIIIMLLYRLALSVTASVLRFVGANLGGASFSAFRSALDALISVYTVSALIYILEIIVFVKGGVNMIG